MRELLAICWFACACTAAEPEFRTFVEVQENGIFQISPAELAKTNSTPLFKALSAFHWPPGYIPLFAVEREQRFELRRRPPKGQENFTEPLFFALPSMAHSNAIYSGRWIVEATREDGSKPFLAWDLAIEGDLVAGRLDQDTDYRHAFITGGEIKGKQLHLNLEYINDKFLITGTISTNQFAGSWSKTDGSESGSITAKRPATASVQPPGKKVALHIWRKEKSIRYSPETRKLPPSWKDEGIICFVWELN